MAIMMSQTHLLKRPEDLLKKFLMTYEEFLNPKGILIIELIDSIADYRISRDHKAGEASEIFTLLDTLIRKLKRFLKN